MLIIEIIIAAFAGACGVFGSRESATKWIGAGVVLLAIDIILILVWKMIY